MLDTAQVSVFVRGRTSFQLLNDQGEPQLRLPQIGAIHAVAGHLSTHSEPAIVAVPTGVGKTAIMLALPYVLGSRRVLVVVPNRLLRQQIVDAFTTMDDLRRRGVLSRGPNPVVHEIQHKMTQNLWDDIRADVVISTPNCISPIVAGVAPPPRGLFDTILIDEAHHAAAEMWAALLEHQAARTALFTATPYRRDQEPVPGTLVYEYSMVAALRDGFIVPITMQRISCEGSDPDDALIERVRSLTSSIGDYKGVPFLVRTDSVKHAKELVRRYEAAGLQVSIILGEHSLRHASSVIRNFIEGHAQGLVLVGVLGEGFNYPDIKLAAYHRRHKSLAPALQFFGRLGRRGSRDIEPLVLFPDHEVRDETAELYRKNADWGVLIPLLADEKIATEQNSRAIRAAYGKAEFGKIAETAIRPKQSVSVFELSAAAIVTLDFAHVPRVVLSDVLQRFEPVTGSTSEFIAWISVHTGPPAWARRSDLQERLFNFCCAVYSATTKLLVVHAHSHAEAQRLANYFCYPVPRSVPPGMVQGMVNEMGVLRYFNVGSRGVGTDSASRPAYKINAGRDVGAASYSPGESEAYAFGHGTAKVKDNVGVIGTSVRGKVWTYQSSDSLPRFVQWCERLADMMSKAKASPSAPLLNFRPASRAIVYPENPVSASIIAESNSDQLSLFLHGRRINLIDCDLILTRTSDEECRVKFEYAGEPISEISISLGAIPVWIGEAKLRHSEAVDNLDAAEYFSSNPLTLFFGDGSSVRGELRFEPSNLKFRFDPSRVETMDWASVDVTRESGPVINNQPSIQGYLAEHLKAQFPKSLIINDDGKGELSDLLVVTDLEESIMVRLYHCKNGRGAGADLDDMYEVVGQAQRSARWALNAKAFWLDLSRRLENRPQTKVLQTFSKEEPLDGIKRIAQSAQETRFDISVVQPFLNVKKLKPGDTINTLICMCDGAVLSTGATMHLVCADVSMSKEKRGVS